MKTELVPISKLKLLDNNPRTISKEQMQKLCKSIQDDPEFLNARPILVNKTTEHHEGPSESLSSTKDVYTVYAGNQRVRAAKKLKMKEIPCIVEFDIPEEILKKRTVLDNSSFGEWNFEILANEFDVEMLLDCGFNPEEILEDLSNISDDERLDGSAKDEGSTCDKCGSKIKKGKK